MEELFPFSKLVDPAEMKRTDCFTTLPVRVSRYDHLAVEGSKHFSMEWEKIVGEPQPITLYLL